MEIILFLLKIKIVMFTQQKGIIVDSKVISRKGDLWEYTL